jgi:protein-tyrosine phosphatase
MSTTESNASWGCNRVPDIFWIDGKPAPGMAIVTRPQGMESLRDEMQDLKRGGIDTLVSLLERHEAEWLGLKNERTEAEKAGLAFLNFPIPDTCVPANLTQFRPFAASLASRLQQGERIGVHCRGSIGRATVTAACTLIHLGWNPAAALAAVEATRGCAVPDTEEQRAWILAYEAAR